MSGTKQFANLRGLARNIRNTLGTEDTADTKNYYLLFAYNGTGKTRLSVEFKNLGKRKIPGSEEIHCIIMPIPKIFSTGIMI